MDPFLPVEMVREAAKERRIQFSVPSAVPTQLDPLQVEMIRQRRPTPATLFRLTDQPSSEDDCTAHQCEHGVLKAKRVNATVYQPPSLKAVQRMAQAHMLTLGSVDREEGSSEEEESQEVCPPTGSDSPKESKCTDGQSARFLGSEVNSMGRPFPFHPLRDQRGEEGEEEEEDDDGRHGKGE